MDMNRTKVIINYLRPLLMLEDPQLESFITESVVLCTSLQPVVAGPLYSESITE